MNIFYILTPCKHISFFAYKAICAHRAQKCRFAVFTAIHMIGRQILLYVGLFFVPKTTHDYWRKLAYFSTEVGEI